MSLQELNYCKKLSLEFQKQKPSLLVLLPPTKHSLLHHSSPVSNATLTTSRPRLPFKLDSSEKRKNSSKKEIKDKKSHKKKEEHKNRKALSFHAKQLPLRTCPVKELPQCPKLQNGMPQHVTRILDNTNLVTLHPKFHLEIHLMHQP